MKLRDLDARFLHGTPPAPVRISEQDSVEGMQGILFQCPKCAAGLERGEEDGRGFAKGAHYVRIFFNNPRGSAVAPKETDKNPRWTMSGNTIDDLTLEPSVNLDVPDANGERPGCGWHGWVKNGDAE